MSETIDKKRIIKNDEIDLVEVFRQIWAGRKTIYKVIVVFFIVGIIVAFGTPNEYKSEITLLVESSSSSSGIGGMLQQFGLTGLNNLSTNTQTKDALKPEFYPEIIKSTPFLLEVMEQKVTESKYDSTLTVENYLKRHIKTSLLGVFSGYTIGLPRKTIGWIRGIFKTDTDKKIKNRIAGPFRLTKEQLDISKVLIDRIKTKQGGSTNTLVISIEMQDPVVATQMTDSVVKSLTRYITEYRTQKANNDLTFLIDRHNEIEAKYISAQRALASYRDQNKYVIHATAKSEEDRLQSEYNLVFNLYNTISQQLEQAKIKVQENTPIFKVVEPAMVPLDKSKPNISLILVGMSFLGGLIGVGIILFKYFRFKFNAKS